MYKRKPCVLRLAQSRVASEKFGQILVSLPGDIEDYDHHRKLGLASAIAAYLGVPVEDVRIRDVTKGSVIVRLEVPEDHLRRLALAAEQWDPRLFELINLADTIEIAGPLEAMRDTLAVQRRQSWMPRVIALFFVVAVFVLIWMGYLLSAKGLQAISPVLALTLTLAGLSLLALLGYREQQFAINDLARESARVLDDESPAESTKDFRRFGMYSDVVEAALRAKRQAHGAEPEDVDVEQAMREAVDTMERRMNRRLAAIGLLGSAAPFIGLFGTVWGIYRTLSSFPASGSVSVEQMVQPIGEALSHTAIGLFVAVPAVLVYNWLKTRNDSTVQAVREFGDQLVAELRNG